MNNNRRFIWLNGRFVSEDRAVLPAVTKGVMYGAGCFETIRATDGSFLHLERHVQRFNRALAWLEVPVGQHVNEEDYRGILKSLLSNNHLETGDAVIRHQGLQGGGRGYGMESDREFIQFISADRLSPLPDSCKLRTSAIRVVPAACRPARLKLSNTVHLMSASREARASGGDDALLLTTEGAIAETTVANLFWKSGDVVYTPAESCDILPGIMRNIVISVISDTGMARVEEGRFGVDALARAEIAWVTNSVKGIQPVSSVDDRELDVKDPFFQLLGRQLENYKRRYLV